jgi:hypothetical protein
MGKENIYPGSFEIDGKQLSSEVYSWASNSFLQASDSKSKTRVKLYVFNPSLFSKFNGRSLSDAIKYSISGAGCAGIIRGPLGNTSDGEFIWWDVDNIELSFHYKNRQLYVYLIGTSLRGFGGFRGKEKDSDPLQFRIHFIVPEDRLKEYLQLSDSAWGFFYKNLSKAQEPISA